MYTTSGNVGFEYSYRLVLVFNYKSKLAGLVNSSMAVGDFRLIKNGYCGITYKRFSVDGSVRRSSAQYFS